MRKPALAYDTSNCLDAAALREIGFRVLNDGKQGKYGIIRIAAMRGGENSTINSTEEGKQIKVAPLTIYAVLKEIHELRRFQVLVHPENRIELRLEVKEGVQENVAFEMAKTKLKEFLASQGIIQIKIELSKEPPKQNPNSGKFKHIINLI